MATDDKVKVLEDEFKLIKSELRQTLVSVREFLLDLKIPPIQEEANPPERPERSPVPEMLAIVQLPRTEQPGQYSGPEESTSYDRNNCQEPEPPIPDFAPEDPTPPLEDIPPYGTEVPPDTETEDNEMTSGEIPMDKEPEVITSIVEEVSDMRIDETIASTSQVNLLANLIRWVSVAKKEIGIEQLSVFLDVYAIGDKLSEEMKVIILHLAEVATDPVMDTKTTDRNELSNDPIALCMEINSLSGQLTPELRDSIRRLTELIIQQSFRLNKADTWSQLLLELHGILTGGGTLQRLFTKNGVKEEKIEEDKVEENQAREDEIADSSSEDSAVSEHLEETPDNPTVQKGLRPARLRLVLPIENGSEQELDLGSFFIETDSSPKKGNGHKKLSLPKR